MDTKKLRQKVLDLAIHGKLVKQDPNDEPASILLDRIRAEKAWLVKEGKIKKSDLIEKPISEDEIPFEVPEGWEWCKIHYFCDVVRGGSPRPAGSEEFYNGPIPFLKVADLTKDNSRFVNEASNSIKEAGLQKTRFIDSYNFLLTNSGATLGVPKINTFPTSFNDGIAAFLGLNQILFPYFYYFFLSKTNELRAINQGAAQPNLNTDLINSILLPLPPLAEQHRIVKAVDELFEQIDIIERSEKELQEAANKTRDKLLNLAIQGHLVPQDPNEEPASVLLERIRAEKARLVKEGKLKLSKTEKSVNKEISEDFELPSNWIWAQLNDVCRVFGRIGFRGYTKDDLTTKNNGAITISPSNIIDGKMDFSNCTYISWEKYEESPEIKVNVGDILIVKTASVGKTAIVNGLPEKATVNPQVAVIKDIVIDPLYLSYFLQCPYAQLTIQDFVIGTAVPTFSQQKLMSMSIPLPPLSEQRRIVTKLEELLQEIDKLKV